MSFLPTSTDYFSKDNGSRSSSSTVTPWTPAIPRTVPSIEALLRDADELVEEPTTANYTHLPSGERKRFPSMDSDCEFPIDINKPAGASKQSRFSHLFDWSPLIVDKTRDINPTGRQSLDLGLPAFGQDHAVTGKDAWCTAQLESAVQPVNPLLANLVPLLEKSVWQARPEEIARHVRTASEQQRKRLDCNLPTYQSLMQSEDDLSPFDWLNDKPHKQLAPIGTPLTKKTPTSTCNLKQQSYQPLLPEADIQAMLYLNWETPESHGLTPNEIAFLMSLDSSTTEQAPSTHRRNISIDTSRGSLSPEPSSSLLASAPTSSPATSSSTTGKNSINFTNAEAQAQQQREMDIALKKEQRAARERAERSLPMPVPMPMEMEMPTAARAPALASGSRLPASTAAAPPFVPRLVQMMGSDVDVVSLLGRQILELQVRLGALGAMEE
ncbi:hypothetical protein MMC16_002267 [Acarospora aff. strigata]|nr:hypothetical protein [Acarospora aff. strigata]